MPNVLSPRDLVSRPDNVDKTVLSSSIGKVCPNIMWFGKLNASEMT